MITPSFPTNSALYKNDQLNRIAFPLGGIGSGMICMEGTGSFTSVSLRHHPSIYFEPNLFSAISVKGKSGQANQARVLTGPVPGWKTMFPFSVGSSGNGGWAKHFGLPRFESASFSAQFPFSEVTLTDSQIPLNVQIIGWSPFIPNDADNSSLPVAAVEYRFTNPTNDPIEAVFSFHTENFMRTGPNGGSSVKKTKTGILLAQTELPEKKWDEGYFAAWIDDDSVQVNPSWFRGGWFDSLTMVWKSVQNAECIEGSGIIEGLESPGGSLYLPIHLAAGEEKTVVLKWAWYVPYSDQHANGGGDFYRPWYAQAFANIGAVSDYWTKEYVSLRKQTALFTETFYDSTLPPEVIEAVSANLTILKSPTVLRQDDGRLWAWEGSNDWDGSCHGTCTHVWNYAQALPHLFPELERGLRETECFVSQNEEGHQNFRTSLPIKPNPDHSFHSAADGQLGGIIKVYRDWRISGNLDWVKTLWPKVKQSLDYCIESWDPDHRGTLLEPHHNTYDIEFWGEDGMCVSIYLGALAAAIEIGEALGEPTPLYTELLSLGKTNIAKSLFNGSYFQQNIQWKGLRAEVPVMGCGINEKHPYSPEALALLETEGPKYQYGTGCLSDGVIGAWMGWAAGLAPFLEEEQVRSHLDSVFQYNFKSDLTHHANPQRGTYALGKEGGLLLCSWPQGGRLSVPFVYSEEVWTGIEYQVAAHLISIGRIDEGLKIVRTTRARYDGRTRNPFNEFECGHWYARAMASYSLLQALSGARYDAVDKTLYLNPAIQGDFRSFISTATGFGTVGVKNGKPFLEIREGEIDVQAILHKA